MKIDTYNDLLAEEKRLELLLSENQDVVEQSFTSFKKHLNFWTITKEIFKAKSENGEKQEMIFQLIKLVAPRAGIILDLISPKLESNDGVTSKSGLLHKIASFIRKL